MIMSFVIVFTIISSIVTNGKSVNKILFYDKNDTYMDFFNSLIDAKNPYDNNKIYPPLSYVFYHIVSKFIPRDIYSQGSFTVRSSQMGRFIIGIYITFSTLLFVYAVFKLKKGSLEENILFILILLLSSPFLFSLERGNLIFLTCSFIMLFLYGYNSDKTLIKHLSFICLSIAAAFKIYPTIFGFLLLKEKRWKDAIICFCYGISIFFLPIVFVGGFSKFPSFINNIIRISNMLVLTSSTRIQLSVTNLLNVLSKRTNIESLSKFGSYATILVLIIGIIILLFADYKEKWKILSIPTLLMISVPKFSFIYAMVFITIPLIYFLNKEDFYKKDIFYLFLFILMLAPFPIKGTGYVESFGLYVMMTMLYIEGIIIIWKKAINIKRNKSITTLEEDNA